MPGSEAGLVAKLRFDPGLSSSHHKARHSGGEGEEGLLVERSKAGSRGARLVP